MTTEQAIQAFEADLKLCGCMGTRRDAVRRLAQRIGHINAFIVAESHGLVSSFYKN